MLIPTARTMLLTAALLLVGAPIAAAPATATVGAPAPAFTATDTSGRQVSLASFKGRHVVLEWVNPGCPFVRKHYDAQNMQGTQKSAAAQGVVWLAVNSTSADHVDYLPPAKMAAWMKQQGAAADATLMDESGKIGRAYGARTTPHMYLIDPQGVLLYAGAIDNKPTANPADIAGATNHVRQALDEALAGRPLSVATTRAYGCTIKYAEPG